VLNRGRVRSAHFAAAIQANYNRHIEIFHSQYYFQNCEA
jgi:hypothetical protein